MADNDPGADLTTLIGRRVGTYQVTALLGKGGMGEVYRARDTRLGQRRRFVIFQRAGTQNSFDLLAVRPGAAEAPIPVATTEHGEREGRFSPDVRWVAYDSTETGRREVWIQPFPPTGARWNRNGAVPDDLLGRRVRQLRRLE
jgi:serine/threonine protein kinase